MSNPLLAGKSAIFAQRYGAPNKPEYLGCHDLQSYEISDGDITLIRCPDRTATGKWKVVGSYQGSPSVPAVTLTTLMAGAADYLEHWPCPGNIIVNKQECGRRDILSNWIRRFVLYNATRTKESADKLVARQDTDEGETTQTFDYSPWEILKLFQVTGGKLNLAAANVLNAITACGENRCAGACGDAQELCDELWAAGSPLAGSAGAKANVYHSSDGGITWAPTAYQPFDAAEEINDIICFPISNSVTRIMVMRGTADAGNGPEIAYSDDGGATWDGAEIDTTNGLYGLGTFSLFALDAQHIWAVTTDGYICFSEDGGETWTTLNAGVLTIDNLFGVAFANTLVGYVVGGANGLVARTADGGRSWDLLTLPAILTGDPVLALAVLSENQIWITGAAGDVFYSADGGTNWTRFVLGYRVVGIVFVHPIVGWAWGEKTAGVYAVWRTTDGGATWDIVDTNATDETMDILPCSLNSAVSVGGDAAGGFANGYNQVN